MRSRGAALFAASVVYGVTTSAARADEKQVCLSAFDSAQQLRIDGKLRSAREQLASCARTECPPLVRQDCGRWLNEVMGSLPSMVFGARDASGRDLLAVRVSIDGALVSETLDGKPVLVDPGVHKFRFETPGSSAVEQQVLIRAGEKSRVLTIDFSPKSVGSPKNSARVDPVPRKPEAVTPSPPVPAYVVGGVGVLALGAALFFDLNGHADASALRATCAPSCAQSDVDRVQLKYIVAGASLGIGVVALGVATYLFFSHSSDGPRASTSTAMDLSRGRF
jgi:type II secretory pathway pseudopilin PulG